MTSGENHTLESGSNGLVELMVPSAIGPKSAAYDRQLPFRLVHHFLLYCLHSRPDYASTIDCTDDAENFATLIDEAKFRKLGSNVTHTARRVLAPILRSLCRTPLGAAISAWR
jgi:hypothetical protein